jgi:hypothetical protein
MKKLKKLIVSLLLLVAAFGFLMLITGMLSVPASAEKGTYCDSGKTMYCWTSLPYWECRDQIGGVHCADPVN